MRPLPLLLLLVACSSPRPSAREVKGAPPDTCPAEASSASSACPPLSVSVAPPPPKPAASDVPAWKPPSGGGDPCQPWSSRDGMWECDPRMDGDPDIAYASLNPRAVDAAIAAAHLESCRRDGGPSGPGAVHLTFATSGAVTSVRLGGAPYEGTTAGACMVALLAKVKVPPFTGRAVTLIKSVALPP